MSYLTLHKIDTSRWFIFFAILVSLCSIASVYLENYMIWLLPFSLIGIGIIADDYRKLYYLLFILLPFTIEFYFDGIGIGTDLPSEPIMIILTGLTLYTWIGRRFALDINYVKNPIMILLTIHVLWIFVTTLHSTYFVISLKLLLAKLWYIVPFMILPLLFAAHRDDMIRAYRLLYKFVFISMSIVLVRHAIEGFSFASSYDVVRPFYRNHVAYASILVICLPFVWAFFRVNILLKKPTKWLTLIFVGFIVAIYFSYTRAAILSMFIAWGAYYIIKYRFVKPTLAITSMIALVGILYLSFDNKYMDFAPNFEKTITHTEFDNLVEATYNLEDISTMERVYRWMAGVEMIKDKFWMGFGPGTFYNNYQLFSISRFQTYVSDNPEKSGIHNYYLMTWVEQGLIGFLIFIILCFAILLEGERLYHLCHNKEDQYYIMAATLGFIIIFAMCLINDLIETDKVGPFFFLNIAILLFYSKQLAHEASE
jgi:O-antigen ligase